MDSNRRTLQLVFEDLVIAWGELHNDAKAARVCANEAYLRAMDAETAIDTQFALLMKTVNDQLESDRQSDQVDQH